MSVQRSAKPVTAYGRSLLSAADAATAMNSISPQTTKGDLIVEQGGSNVAASGGGASSSNGDGSLPAHAFNGVEGTDSVSPAGTGWRSNGNPAWLSNDLGSAQAIGSIRVLLGTGASRKFAGFALSWSDNNSTWTAVPGASIGAWAQDTTLNFTPITHRYWRLDFGNSSLGGDCIEWQIFSSLSAVRTAVATNGTVLQSDSTAARGVSYTHPKDPVKAGTPTDSDVISTAASGMGIVDTTGVKLWKRFGTTWTAVGPLDVSEVDGSPTSSSISKLVFPNDTVTISGSTATIRQVPQAFIGCQIYNPAGTQTFATATQTPLTATTELFDSDGFHEGVTNPSRFTIPAGMGGKYLVSATGYWTNHSGGNERTLFITVNNTTPYRGRDTRFPNSSVFVHANVSAVIDLVAGDYVQVQGYHDRGSNSDFNDFRASIVKLDSGKVGAGIGAKAYNSTTQSIANTTQTVLTLDSEDFDTDGFHSTSSNTGRMTVPAGLGGKYLCTARTFANWTASSVKYLSFLKNGNATAIQRIGGYLAATDDTMDIVGVFDLVPGDYIEVSLEHNNGSSQNAGHASARRVQTEFSMMRLDSGSTGVSALPNPASVVVVTESEFTLIGPSNGGVCGVGMTVNSGSGGTPVTGAVSDGRHIGTYILSTGTSTSGRSGINVYSDSVLFGTAAAVSTSWLKIPTLSDGTNTFTVWCGFGNGLAGDPADGAFFRYTHSVNSGKWQAVTRANSVETASAIDTGITTDTGWHKYEVSVNAGGTSVAFYIDDVLVSTNTANIPTGTGRECEPAPPYILKSAGSTARTLEIDYHRCTLTLTTSR